MRVCRSNFYHLNTIFGKYFENTAKKNNSESNWVKRSQEYRQNGLDLMEIKCYLPRLLHFFFLGIDYSSVGMRWPKLLYISNDSSRLFIWRFNVQNDKVLIWWIWNIIDLLCPSFREWKNEFSRNTKEWCIILSQKTNIEYNSNVFFYLRKT